MIAYDCETTGLDLYHGASIFFVTVCFENNEILNFEPAWHVDPRTREVTIPPKDLQHLLNVLDDANSIVGQNIKFDAAFLEKLVPGFSWPWEKTHDTLIASHILASNQPHDLTSLVLHYLGIDIQPYEDKLEQAVLSCRRQVQQARLRVKRRRKKEEQTGQGSLFTEELQPFANWRIAEKNLEEMPSAKDKTWKFDSWLPLTLATEVGLSASHWYRTVLRYYANVDSGSTLPLWHEMEARLKSRDLWEIYLHKMSLLPIVSGMEKGGVTLQASRVAKLEEIYTEESREAAAVCTSIAADLGYDLRLPKSGNNDSLTEFLFGDVKSRMDEQYGGNIPGTDGVGAVEGCLNLPIVKWTDKGAPSLDKYAMDEYENVLPPNSLAKSFIRALKSKRKRDTAITYLKGYRRYWLPLHNTIFPAPEVDPWYLLHQSINPTGTSTIRWSTTNPNVQNISKQGMPCFVCSGPGCEYCNDTGVDPRSLRYCFGPAPGREWWSCDFKNVELRIPAYESGEEELIALFERPDEAPYYGSQHILNFQTVYPDIWEAELKKTCHGPCCKGKRVDLSLIGPHCKKVFASTWYQWCKNGDFAIQYQCGEAKADQTFHRAGAFKALKSRFVKQEKLNQKQIKFAEKHGYVETIPDRTVNPRHGYPLLCTRTEYGGILNTIPLSYHTQGTAMWLTERAMIRCQEQLDAWREEEAFAGRIVLQVHDELVFDFPRVGDPVAERAGKAAPGSSNLQKVRRLQELMAKGGKDLIVPIPTPVGCEFHDESWAEGLSL